MDHELTHEERLAIAALKRLAKRWPQSLWLFSAGSSLHVMRQPEDALALRLGWNRGYLKRAPSDSVCFAYEATMGLSMLSD